MKSERHDGHMSIYCYLTVRSKSFSIPETKSSASAREKRGALGGGQGHFFVVVGKDGRVGWGGVGWGEVTFCHLLNAEVPLGG